MQNYRYTVKYNNKILNGYIKASDITEAAFILEKKGYIILEIKEEILSEKFHKNYTYTGQIKTFSLKEKKEFFTSFYYLYKSGISIVEIFKSILISSNNKNIKNLCSIIVKQTEKGNSLKESMLPYSCALGIAYTMLIIAGEESGKLETVLSDIIKNLTREEEIKSNLISSLTYPVTIFFLAIGVFFLFKFFIIQVFNQFAEGISFNCVTNLLITAIIKIIIIYTIIFALIIYFYKNKNIITNILNILSKIKFISEILKNYYFANFFSVISLSYDSGIPATESISLASSVINIPLIKSKLKRAENMVKNGCEITTALKITNIFSGYAISQISAGEQAGELAKIFKIVSYDYEKKLDSSIKIILKLTEPIMIIFVGLIVLYVASTAYNAYYKSLMSLF